MNSKHFHSDPTHLITGALNSLSRLNPSVAVDEKYKIVFVKETQHPQVSVISGGGSGHEPAFASFVGHGMLSGAIAGSIFASPSTQQIQKCLLQCVDTTKGIMVIIMNYTGDVMHFGMAVEKARARGIKVDMLVVGDDVGVGRARAGKLGRRGIAGTVLVQKITCAAAMLGSSLNEVSKVASLVSDNLVSVGASLAHVHVPGRSLITDFNESDSVEVGMGIHNEEGFKRIETDLVGLVKEMLAQLLDLSDTDRGFVDIKSSDSVILLVNNLGGVSALEFGCIVEEVCSQLNSGYSLQLVRILAGTYMSSLNGLGFSISILKIVETGLESGESMVQLLDTSTQATGWLNAFQPGPMSTTVESRLASPAENIEETLPPSRLSLDSNQAVKLLKSGLSRLISAEAEITKYDTMVGDGDCGLCLKNGAEAVLAELEGKEWTDAVQLVGRIAQVVETNMDGTSGAIYAIFFNALAYGLSSQDTSSPTIVTAEMWAKALEHALQSLSKYTPAKPGDRTLIDSLSPFVATITETKDFSQATEAAKKGCESTKGMEASFGRSVYIGGDDWKKCPDPGAYGMVEFLLGMSASF
ncbi:Dak1 domain-containing protein [Calycina marina]|uniref:Dak1 domain-containing protein n=1 Tax=Calycina marina TaxID=1763456 RepID=A0A9P7YWP2_9HELO|nr:Dak1 domain-containing protein [Calycina marina]